MEEQLVKYVGNLCAVELQQTRKMVHFEQKQLLHLLLAGNVTGPSCMVSTVNYCRYKGHTRGKIYKEDEILTKTEGEGKHCQTRKDNLNGLLCKFLNCVQGLYRVTRN